MEFGELAFEVDIEDIEEGDLEVRLSGVFIINTSFGSLLALRSFLNKSFGRGLIHYQVSNDKLYSAKFHELSEEKQNKLREMQNGRR